MLFVRTKDAGRKYCDRTDCPSLSSRFRLRTSGDAEAAAAGYAGVNTVLSERAEASLLGYPLTVASVRFVWQHRRRHSREKRSSIARRVSQSTNLRPATILVADRWTRSMRVTFFVRSE
ncbi:hypothetical protein T265_06754 [Opisthorchis viverrini]|uniref:Uncharacterized protein n=1 Tax=Opisthorchis viverrini TaxID=6198 RepID=A0A074ZF34_OPIVI|nr:hypothetical protein T265_06754 [Opisthorchis viverrini]KER25901.1 hypothetical protein T265_06754 [Opisthorchis viverrini]